MTSRDLHDAAAAYALGAVDPAEQPALDALFARDAEFRKEVERYREVAGLLAWAAPSTPAPDRLRDRILSDARQVRSISAAPRDRTSVAPTRGPGWVRVIPWLAAAASLAVAVLNQGRVTRTRDALATLQQELSTTRDDLALKERTIAAFMGPEVHVVSLSQAEGKPTARVFWNHTRNVFIVSAFNVPKAPAGKTYQLWAIKKGSAPISMGTFDTDEEGSATVIVPVSTAVSGVDFVDLCAMTLEPIGGSPQPTETPRLVGSWRHTD
jgi:anti-sigma-K factor RskA